MRPASELSTLELEIGARSHYHSGLLRGWHRAGPRKPLKTLVITKLKTAAAVISLLSLGALAQAEGDVEAGRAIGSSCLGCHGIEGYRNAYPSYRVPKLGGQKETYLVDALKGYRDGSRQHTTMNAQAVSMTDQQIEDVAAYFASLSDEVTEGSEGQSLEVATACVACHGQNGIGLSPAWPTIAGQHEDYLVHSLQQYRDGTRKNAIMAGFAAQLSDADIALLARYYASLDGLETTARE